MKQLEGFWNEAKCGDHRGHLYVLVCPTHRSNGGIRKPRTGCAYCWGVYRFRRVMEDEESDHGWGWPVWRSSFYKGETMLRFTVPA